MTGQSTANDAVSFLSSAASVHSAPAKASAPADIDPNADDPVEASNASATRLMEPDGQPKVIVPSISIKSEFPSIPKSKAAGKAQLMTAMITIAVPSAGNRGKYPARVKPFDLGRQRQAAKDTLPQLPPSPQSSDSYDGLIPSTARSAPTPAPDPFAHVLADLRNRLVDYNNSGLDSFGSLRLFDLLSVRKGTFTQEFNMYLFPKAIICVSEEKKKSFRNVFSSAASMRSNNTASSDGQRGVLRLKGRIHLKHVTKVVDTSLPGELSLTIYMSNEGMEPCVLVFRDRGSHETWKRHMVSLVESIQQAQVPDARTTDSSKKIAKLMGAGAPTPISANGPARSYDPPSATSSGLYGDMMMSPSSGGHSMLPATPASLSLSSEPTRGDLAFVAPLAPVHTPLDVVIVLSLPACTASPGQPSSTVPLKTRLVRQSLAFALATLGPQDRVALVACEMGVNGTVRKTPFLNVTKYDSRRRLEAFVEAVGTGRTNDDEFECMVGPDETMDVVTAMNIALDVVLQRKAKNPLGGMILISDTADSIKRAQMDLVTARLDAANLPVHAIVYGKGHDPSPLWMISNHTFGTYTFVREWYDLRDTVAGLLGGMMSIAMTKFNLHLSCQAEFKVLKTAGSSHSLIGQNGKEVDLELRELRFGETREVLVELDLADQENGSNGEGNPQRYSGSSTSDRAPSRPGTSAHGSIRGMSVNGDGASNEGGVPSAVFEDQLVDEWPVTEVDCSWHDPAAGRSVARLSHPVLLTVAILPSKAIGSSAPADPTLVRRRMEVLASDMITRALLIASRKNYAQASRILSETNRIISKVTQSMEEQLSTMEAERARGGGTRGMSKRETATRGAVEGMKRVSVDLESLVEGLDEQPEMFERDYRNFAAQQAVVLRLQKSWTTRTPSETAYCTPGILEIVRAASDWSGRE